MKVTFDFSFDVYFWAVFPAFNINTHTSELEFEYLCFGVYIKVTSTKKRNELIKRYNEGVCYKTDKPCDCSGLCRESF